jgi:hypothetical protein
MADRDAAVSGDLLEQLRSQVARLLLRFLEQR